MGSKALKCFENAMRIDEGLEVLELKMGDIGGMQMIIYLTLTWDGNEAVLIDAADPFQVQKIREAMDKAGISLDRLSKIIITHHDMDHIGSLESLVKESENRIEVLAHELEEPYILGEKPSIKMTPERMNQMKKDLKSMPEDRKKAFDMMFAKRDVKISYLHDGEELPYCGGIIVIHTPGHTPGHICLYLKKYNALVAGDAMIMRDGQLLGPAPEHTFDMKEALESLKKFTQYDIKTVICYHGGIFSDNPNIRIRELAFGSN